MDSKGIYWYKLSLWRFHSQLPCCAANTTLCRSLSGLVSSGRPCGAWSRDSRDSKVLVPGLHQQQHLYGGTYQNRKKLTNIYTISSSIESAHTWKLQMSAKYSSFKFSPLFVRVILSFVLFEKRICLQLQKLDLVCRRFGTSKTGKN